MNAWSTLSWRSSSCAGPLAAPAAASFVRTFQVLLLVLWQEKLPSLPAVLRTMCAIFFVEKGKDSFQYLAWPNIGRYETSPFFQSTNNDVSLRIYWLQCCAYLDQSVQGLLFSLFHQLCAGSLSMHSNKNYDFVQCASLNPSTKCSGLTLHVITRTLLNPSFYESNHNLKVKWN